VRSVPTGTSSHPGPTSKCPMWRQWNSIHKWRPQTCDPM